MGGTQGVQWRGSQGAYDAKGGVFVFCCCAAVTTTQRLKTHIHDLTVFPGLKSRGSNAGGSFRIQGQLHSALIWSSGPLPRLLRVFEQIKLLVTIGLKFLFSREQSASDRSLPLRPATVP